MVPDGASSAEWCQLCWMVAEAAFASASLLKGKGEHGVAS